MDEEANVTRSTSAVADPPARRSRAAKVQTPPVDQPRLVRGLKVVSEEQIQSNLPGVPGQPKPMMKFSKLTLEDGSEVFECHDCGGLGDTRGEAQKHRAEEHGVGYVGNSNKGKLLRQVSPGLNAEALAMTLGELLELAAAAPQWGQMIEQLTLDRDQWKDRALAAERETRKWIGQFERMGFVPKELKESA